VSCKHSHVAVMAPIADLEPEDHAHFDSLHELLSPGSWTRIEFAYLNYLPMLHMARFQIIDHLYPGMGADLPADRLNNKYLLFIAEIDGHMDDFFDQLFYQRPDVQSPSWPGWRPDNAGNGLVVREIWQHCGGYPIDDAAYLFRRYMHRYLVPTGLPYAGTDACLDEILRALLIKELTGAWIATETLDAGAMLAGLDAYIIAVRSIGQLNVPQLIQVNDLLFNQDIPFDFGQIVDKL